MADMQSLAEEALGGNVEAGEVLEQKIEEALACPCVEELRNGPCGKQFVGAFSCYVRNFKAESLDGCYPKFEAMSDCMANNPAVFHKHGSSYQTPNESTDKRTEQ